MLIDGEAAGGEDAQYDFDLFVIGGGSGGVRASRTSAGFGAKVAVNYNNNEARAQKTMSEFRERGISCELFRADVIDESSINAMFDEIETVELGQLSAQTLDMAVDGAVADVGVVGIALLH